MNSPADAEHRGGTVRLRLDLAYDGSGFAGWARQPDQRTVCGELEAALALLVRKPVRVVVAGRTDSGVHATGQVAHLDLAAGSPFAADPTLLLRRLARILPTDVRVFAVSRAPESFDARFSALRRHYCYRIGTAAWGVLPFDRATTWHRPTRGGRAMDVVAMNRASEGLLGLRDFAAFCRAREGATTLRELQAFHWQQQGDVLRATVVADAFCWSMVRSLVGALVAVGEGRRGVDWPASLLGATRRCQEVSVAPALGLCLIAVDYPAPEELAARNERTRTVRGRPGTDAPEARS